MGLTGGCRIYYDNFNPTRRQPTTQFLPSFFPYSVHSFFEWGTTKWFLVNIMRSVVHVFASSFNFEHTYLMIFWHVSKPKQIAKSNFVIVTCGKCTSLNILAPINNVTTHNPLTPNYGENLDNNWILNLDRNTLCNLYVSNILHNHRNNAVHWTESR